MAINTVHEKFLHELQDIYDAEHQFLEGQQQMLAQAQDAALQTMIQTHIGETEQQIRNLEEVFSLLGTPARRVQCDGANGLVREGHKAMQEAASNRHVLDLVIAGAAAKV